MERIINCMPNLDKYTEDVTRNLFDILKQKGFTPNLGFNKMGELNIAIGGDGAFLRAVRDSNFSDIPFVGINTGTLGFYPEIAPTQIEEFVIQYKNNDYKINEMSIIECNVRSEEKTITTYAVNDVAIKRGDMKTAHLNMYFNDNYLQTISGDGIIVSSPLGSSAYNYSVGGALVYPSLKTLQISPISPLNSNSYRCLNSSLIVPPDFNVKITPERKTNYLLSLIVDGIIYNYKKLDYIEFYTSKKTLKQLTIGNYNYWNVIKDKLL